MAKATWSREPAVTPPATFTLTLSEDEAAVLEQYLGVMREPAQWRLANPQIYNISEALDDARSAAGK